MKLKNKKTGEIRELPDGFFCGDNLKKICEEWEDVPEEPKDFWFIDADGEVRETNYLTGNDKSSLRNFGNYFLSREEAEEAVEKLKAWKRLKDKGFRFSGWKIDQKKHLGVITIKTEPYYSFEFDDLDLLFSGGEK